MKTWLPLLLALLLGTLLAQAFTAPFAIGVLAACGVWLLRRQARLEAELRQLRAALEPAHAPGAVPAAEPVAAQPAEVQPVEDVASQPVAAAPVPAAEAIPIPAPAASVEADDRSIGVTSSLGATLKAWFTGGNTIVRLAVLILFLGVAFLLRYAAERAVIPIELRLAGVAAGALALVLLGWRLRARRRGYGLSLQGAGIGMLYLTLFAALRLYGLLPAALAFALLAALGACAALLALRQDALPLAVLGTAGGFLAPVLTSTGEGSHVALFSYYLLLNLGIAFIARHKAWKLLNLLGLAFTFGIGLGWGFTSWRPALLASTEPFLVAHVALYLWVAVQYALRMSEAPADAGPPAGNAPVRPEPVEGQAPTRGLAASPFKPAAYADGALLFGMPLAAFGLQAGMVRDMPYALAASAAVLAAVYLLLGRWLWRRLGERLRLVTEGMLALGVVFAALVAPLALDDARWTAVAWALQGAGVAWVALRQRRAWALALGVALQALALVAFWGEPLPAQRWPFANAPFLMLALIAAALLFSALQLQRLGPAAGPWSGDGGRFAPRPTPAGLYGLHAALLAIGALHLAAGVLREVARAPWTAPDTLQSALLALAALALLFEALHRPLRWPELSMAARAALALGAALWLQADVKALVEPAGAWRWWWPWGSVTLLAWLAAAAWVLHRLDHDPAPGRLRRSLGAEHVAYGWVALAGAALWAHDALGTLAPRHEGWTAAALLAAPTALAWAALSALRRGRWPMRAHPGAWLRGWAAPWLAVMALWSVVVNAFDSGGMAPLPYLPLVNPIDLGHGLLLLYALHLRRTWREADLGAPRLSLRGLVALGALLAFWWLDSLLVRTLHHWAGTPTWLAGALGNGLVQTTFTIAWTLGALAAMFVATRRLAPALARPVWLAGAALLALTVLKLMLVDLGQTSALQRIVSFLGVGALMLVIGYVSPLPPAAAVAASRREVAP